MSAQRSHRWGTSRVFNQGIAFHCDGTELYDDGKHLGRVVIGSKTIGLYKERRPYTSTSYQRKLVEFVQRTFGIHGAHIIWF